MTSTIRVVVALSLFLTAASAFAQQEIISSHISPSMMRTDAGWVTPPFQVNVRFAGEVGSNIYVRLALDAGATINRIDATEWTCTIDGATAECGSVATRFPFESRLLLHPRASNANGAHATLTATTMHNDPRGGTDLSAASLQNYFAVIVNNTNDSGPRSLRSAIERANAEGKPAKLLFQIPAPVPSEGWFTIVPESPLPPITTPSMFVDGKSQTRFTGDTNTRGPEIAIDGHLAHRGLEIHSSCEAKVEGLVLGNFDENQGLWFAQHTPCASRYLYSADFERWVADNYIGVDPTGMNAWPNLRGLRADFGSGEVRNNVISGNTYSGIWTWETTRDLYSLDIENNRIGVAADGVTPMPNGAAGMLFGPNVTAEVTNNIIANHPGMGIAIAREGESFVEVRANSMRDNGGIGIDWGVDGVSAPVLDDGLTYPNPPLIVSVRYDPAANITRITARDSVSRPPGPNGHAVALDFYANRAADGDGEQYLTAYGVVENNRFVPDEYYVPGDLRGRWITATATRIPILFARTPGGITTNIPGLGESSTSEFSNAVQVQ